MKLVTDPRDWQPFTFRGVAALAVGPPWRLFKLQLAAGLWVTASLAWFLTTAWWPVIDAAAEQMPSRAVIRDRTFVWEGPATVRLAENQFLGVTVDLAGRASATSTSDLNLELGSREIRIHSLFGYASVPYPGGYIISLSRMEFQAWWGAWRLPLLAVIVIGVLVGLMASWTILAGCYAALVWLISFYADRAATRWVCWRLSAAAMIPSAVLMGATVFLYGVHRLNLTGALFGLVLQWVISGIYVVLAPFWLARPPGKPPRRANPFHGKTLRSAERASRS